MYNNLVKFSLLEDRFFQFCESYFDDQKEVGILLDLQLPRLNLHQVDFQNYSLLIVEFLLVAYLRLFINKQNVAMEIFKKIDIPTSKMLNDYKSGAIPINYMVLNISYINMIINHLTKKAMETFALMHLNQVKDLLNEFYQYFYFDIPMEQIEELKDQVHINNFKVEKFTNLHLVF